MPKTKTQPIPNPEAQTHVKHEEKTLNEPLSGSKTVKNRNHSRNNHGEGH
jgi:small acid-soluble spore protein P (minor)